MNPEAQNESITALQSLLCIGVGFMVSVGLVGGHTGPGHFTWGNCFGFGLFGLLPVAFARRIQPWWLAPTQFSILISVVGGIYLCHVERSQAALAFTLPTVAFIGAWLRTHPHVWQRKP